MKLISIFTFLVLAGLAGCNGEGPVLDAERQRRKQAEQWAAEQEQSTDFWEGITVALGIGAITLLIVGSALGSRARKDATETDRGGPGHG